MLGERLFCRTKTDQKSTAISLFIRLTPNSDKDLIYAIETTDHGSHYKARIRAQPENGKTNAALIKLIAKWLNIPKSSVILKSGSKSRLKNIEIYNPDENTIDLLKKYTASLSQAKPETQSS